MRCKKLNFNNFNQLFLEGSVCVSMSACSCKFGVFFLDCWHKGWWLRKCIKLSILNVSKIHNDLGKDCLILKLIFRDFLFVFTHVISVHLHFFMLNLLLKKIMLTFLLPGLYQFVGLCSLHSLSGDKAFKGGWTKTRSTSIWVVGQLLKQFL